MSFKENNIFNFLLKNLKHIQDKLNLRHFLNINIFNRRTCKTRSGQFRRRWFFFWNLFNTWTTVCYNSCPQFQKLRQDYKFRLQTSSLSGVSRLAEQILNNATSSIRFYLN